MRSAKRRSLKALGAVAIVALAAACGSTSAPGAGQLTVQLSDSPTPNVQTAYVAISRVYLIGGSDTTGPRYTIDSTPHEVYNLLGFQNGITATLGSATIPVGTYSQMRIVVDSGIVVLSPGFRFSDGTTSKALSVPSGMETGVKVVLDTPIQVTPGQTVLVADFDVSRSFVLTGPPTLPVGAIFQPVIHATMEDVAASVAGTVTPASSQATLYAIFTSNDDTVATALADSVSGAYKLWFLPPGAYTIAAVGTGLNGSKSVTLGAAQDRTGVNFP